jgi:DNA-binding IclR family transcriptional regulator
MLATLMERGYVQRSPASGRYALGRGAIRLGRPGSTKELRIKTVVRPFLQRIHKVSRATANLTIPDGNDIVFIGQLLKPDSPLSAPVKMEPRLPAHASASGKAMLAFREPHAVTRLGTREPLKRLTSRTIVDHSALALELETIRERGFAIDQEEYRDGIACIGAPIFDRTGRVVAAISVAGSTECITPELYLDLGELVRCNASEVSARLDYQGST